MPDSRDLESYGQGHRTFDCPWCGAISGIDPSHIGESFDCPECHKSTKLTPENTRDGHLTEAASDAPPFELDEKANEKVGHETSELESYGRGHRTFDCPWCGAISGIDPSHLGETFDCPECHKNTKLTEENTRAAPVTDAPTDAPPHVEHASKVPLLVAVAGVAVVVIAAVIVFAGGGGSEEPRDPAPVEKASTQPVSDDAAGPTEPAPVDVDPPGEGSPTETPGEAPTPGEVPPGEAPVDPPPPEEVPPEPAAAPDPVEEAKVALERAKQALADWQAAHPGEMEVLRLRLAGASLGAQVHAQLKVLGEGDVTPEGARSFNAALRAFIEGDAQRVRVADYLVIHLDRDGIKPHLLDGWKGLNFYAPRVRETLLEVCGAWGGEEIEVHRQLRLAVEEAEAALAEAAAGG